MITLLKRIKDRGWWGLPRIELRAIKNYVKYIREKRKTKPTKGYKPELSCEVHGEGNNLLNVQLIPTKKRLISTKKDPWHETKYRHIRQLVLNQIKIDSGVYWMNFA